MCYDEENRKKIQGAEVESNCKSCFHRALLGSFFYGSFFYGSFFKGPFTRGRTACRLEGSEARNGKRFPRPTSCRIAQLGEDANRSSTFLQNPGSPHPKSDSSRLGDHGMGEHEIKRLGGDDVVLNLRQHLPFAHLFDGLFDGHLGALGDSSDPA